MNIKAALYDGFGFFMFKLVFLVFLVGLCLTLFAAGNAKAAFIDQDHAWEGTYHFIEGDWKFDVFFELFKENDGSNLYQYEYTIINLDDNTNAEFQSGKLSYYDVMDSYGFYDGSGNTSPTSLSKVPATHTLNLNFVGDQGPPTGWNDGIAEGSDGDTIYFTSYAPPVWGGTFTGEGVGTSFATGNIPTAGPVPEPATMFLFGTGLIGLAGYARRKFKK